MSTFTLDLKKFAEKAGINAEKVVKKVALDVTYSVIEMSPVDTGRFKNNWNLAISNINRATTTATDLSGEGSKARANASILSFNIGETIYISNSLPYAQVLEDGRIGNKGSIQAPQGMVKVTLVQYQSFVQKAVKSL